MIADPERVSSWLQLDSMNKAAECGLCFFQVVRVEPALDPGEQPIQQSDHVAAPQRLHVTLHLAARAQLLQFPRLMIAMTRLQRLELVRQTSTSTACSYVACAGVAPISIGGR